MTRSKMMKPARILAALWRRVSNRPPAAPSRAQIADTNRELAAIRRGSAAAEVMAWAHDPRQGEEARDNDDSATRIYLSFPPQCGAKGWYSGTIQRLMRDGRIQYHKRGEWEQSKCRGGWMREYRDVWVVKTSTPDEPS